MNKKAISPVIAISLLVIVSVVAVIGYQNWLTSYESSNFIKIEEKSAETKNDVKIISFIDNILYVKNNGKNNFSLTTIKIGDRDCNINDELVYGMNKINLTLCRYEKGTQEIKLIGEDKLISEKKYLESSYYPRINLMRDGSLTSLGQGLANWNTWNPSGWNDGIKLQVSPWNTNPALTDNEVCGNNLNRGATMTFNRSVSLIELVDYSFGNIKVTEYKVEAYYSGIWNLVYTHTTTPNPNYIKFNEDGLISSNQWRYYISGCNGEFANHYVYELEAYEYYP